MGAAMEQMKDRAVLLSQGDIDLPVPIRAAEVGRGAPGLEVDEHEVAFQTGKGIGLPPGDFLASSGFDTSEALGVRPTRGQS